MFHCSPRCRCWESDAVWRPQSGAGKAECCTTRTPTRLGNIIQNVLPIDLLYTGLEDLRDVRSALEPVIARWKPIGLALGLDPGQLDVIKRDKGNCEDCLTKVLTQWLKRNYNTVKFGEPSWEMLARAVGHRSGGNNSALAQEITRR